MNSLKKMTVFGLILAISGAGFLFTGTNTAYASHDERPLCYLVFWRDNRCDDSNSDSSDPAPASDNTTANQAPVWTGGQTSFSVKTGDLLTFTISAFDPDNDPISYSANYLPNGAGFNNQAAVFSWTPNDNQYGTYALQFSAYDGTTRVYQTINVLVQEKDSTTSSNTATGNYRPMWKQVGDQNVLFGQTLQFAVLATDPDNDAITYSAFNLPNGSDFDPFTKIFSWKPNESQVGSYVITFRAFDGLAHTDLGVLVRVGRPIAFNTTAITQLPAASIPLSDTPERPAIQPEAKIVFSEVKFENSDGEIYVAWKTNIPSGSRVIWDTTAQSEKTRDFSYKNATPDDRALVTDHRVKIGKLEMGTAYYLRLVSKTSRQAAVSNEITLVQLGENKIGVFFGASLIGILGDLFGNETFLWLLIAALGISTFVFYRKHQKNSSPL